MEPTRSVESHLQSLEHDLHAALVPLSEMVNQSRVYAEKSMSVMRDETFELLNKLHGHNGNVLAECIGTRDLASLAAAQERWLTNMSRDWYEANVRIGEATRTFLAESLQNVGAAMRNGNGETVEVEEPQRTNETA